MTRVGVLALLALSLASCTPQEGLEQALQSALNTAWTNSFARHGIEGTAEEALLDDLRDRLNGRTVMQNWAGRVWIRDVKWCDVDLGTTPPNMDVTSLTYWETSANWFVSVGWSLSWPNTNGAQVRFRLDMTSWAGFPDHTVRVHHVGATASGTALVRIPRSVTGSGAITTMVTSATVTTQAEAAGWFWTIDVSSAVNAMMKQELVERIIDQAFERTFGPYL